jgi:hypothetical protein
MKQKIEDLSMKRMAIKESVTKAIQQIQYAKKKSKALKLRFQNFQVIASIYPMSSLLGTSATPKIGVPLTDFVEIIQGVTWGGKGSEQVFDLNEQEVNRLNLEKNLIYKRIGGEDVKRWRIEWTKKYVLFPYVENKNKWSRAFELIGGGIDKPITITDSLDFEQAIDDVELRIRRQNLSEGEKRKKILEHRIAIGLVKYPNVATYLTQHYEQLSGRSFEERALQEYNKMWYEYHRPRTPQIIRKPKIVGPRLVKTAKFALDINGFLPRDSVVALVPKQKTFEDLRKSLKNALSRNVSEEEVLMYILSFLNSEAFDDLLKEKISKKRGGYPIIDERLLQKFGIPIPTKANKNIVEKLLQLVKENVFQNCENDEEINKLVKVLYDVEKGKTEAKTLKTFIK